MAGSEFLRDVGKNL